MLGAYKVIGRYNFKSPKFGGIDMRYNKRLSAYQHFPVPNFISFNEFTKNIDFSEFEPKVILENAVENFKNCKKLVEKLKSLPLDIILPEEMTKFIAFAKIALTNNIEIMKVMKKGYKIDSDLDKKKINVEFIFKVSDVFPHLKLN